MTGRIGNIARWIPALLPALLIGCLAALALAASMRPVLEFQSPRAPAAWAVGSSTFADLSVKANEPVASHRAHVRGVEFETLPSALLEHSAVEASALAFQTDAEQASSQPPHRASGSLMPPAYAAPSTGSATGLRLFPTGPPASLGIRLHA